MTQQVIERFPAGGPRGHWPAEEFARELTAAGQPSTVVMDLEADAFFVIAQSREDR